MKSQVGYVAPRIPSESQRPPDDDQKNAGGTNSPTAFWIFVTLAIGGTIILGFVLS